MKTNEPMRDPITGRIYQSNSGYVLNKKHLSSKELEEYLNEGGCYNE